MSPVDVDPNLLPTREQLRRATLAAVAVAFSLLVIAILPAEAGIDLTGAGRWLGLTALGELKRQRAPKPEAVDPPAPPAIAAVAAPPASPSPYSFRKDELTLTLQPDEGAEIKAVMRAGDQLAYAWTADRGELFFDFHGEPKGAPPEVFTSFEKGSKPAADGAFEAPFEGIHGWYWKNRTAEVVTVKLKTAGVYETIARKP